MSRLRAALIAAFCLSLCVEDATAQLRGGASERDRGILGRVGARRDERLSRNTPPNPGVNPNAAANPLANPNLPTRPPANPYGPLGPNNLPAAQSRLPLNAAAAARAGVAPNGLGTPNAYANRGRVPTPAPDLRPDANAASANAAGAGMPDADSRSAYFAPNNLSPAGAGVRQAAATAPANKLPYQGPGVLIRLPHTIQGEVNYLVDDSEHLVVHSGEDQLLRLKGSYEVRFSRGVTAEGRSYGEARYTITEGVYRFDVSAGGWELYREGEAADVERAVAEAQKRAEDAQRVAELAREEDQLPRSESSVPPLLAPRDTGRTDRPSSGGDKASDQRIPPPSPAPPASEETLPAPKSILEPA